MLDFLHLRRVIRVSSDMALGSINSACAAAEVRVLLRSEKGRCNYWRLCTAVPGNDMTYAVSADVYFHIHSHSGADSVSQVCSHILMPGKG